MERSVEILKHEARPPIKSLGIDPVVKPRDNKNYKFEAPRIELEIISILEETPAMGVVLCHGYLSLPAQMNNLAVHLHKLGMNVYVVRLKGHGTVPSDISKVTMEDWRRSFDRAYAVMSAYCRKVVVGGFSLGGIWH
jgi:esterase/lipase